MSATTSTTPPPSARMILDAVDYLERLVVREDATAAAPDVVDRVRTLLAAHHHLARRHGDARHEIAQHRARAAAVRALCGEGGRYVETVDVERALDDRPAGPGTLG